MRDPSEVYGNYDIQVVYHLRNEMMNKYYLNLKCFYFTEIKLQIMFQ